MASPVAILQPLANPDLYLFQSSTVMSGKLSVALTDLVWELDSGSYTGTEQQDSEVEQAPLEEREISLPPQKLPSTSSSPDEAVVEPAPPVPTDDFRAHQKLFKRWHPI